jgi:hypothetical protein
MHYTMKNMYETGFFMPMDYPEVKIVIAPGQGARLVVPKTFLQCDASSSLGRCRGAACHSLPRMCCARRNGHGSASR